MEIKVAENSDYEVVAKLHAESWQNHYSQILDKQYLEQDVLEDKLAIWQTRLTNPPINQQVLIAYQNGAPCGFIAGFGNHDFELGTNIEALHIDENYLGQGVGRALLSALAKWVEQFFSDRGVYSRISTDNQRAIEFYQHLGAELGESRQWNTPTGVVLEDKICLWKSANKFSLSVTNKSESFAN